MSENERASGGRNVCVFCASSNHVGPQFFEAARRLGTIIGQRGDTLIWGGGRVGLMGEVARAVRAAGGRIVGVIPESMTSVEIAFHEADELIVTETMRQRKGLMDEKADAFVVLPGGFGTLEELSEIMVLRILGYHHRPVVLVNAQGFYDPLLKLFDHFVAANFARPSHLEHLHVVREPEQAYDYIDG